MKILLASCSPRRLALLRELGHEVTVVKPAFDESAVCITDPAALVSALAEGKGRSVTPPPGILLVAADTVVALNGKILGKPASRAEAFHMLRSMSGTEHRVYTGVYTVLNGTEKCFTSCSRVIFRPLGDEEIRAYIATGKPMDKAGAYGIQETDFAETIVGSRTNVMGFPTEQFSAIYS